MKGEQLKGKKCTYRYLYDVARCEKKTAVPQKLTRTFYRIEFVHTHPVSVLLKTAGPNTIVVTSRCTSIRRCIWRVHRESCLYSILVVMNMKICIWFTLGNAKATKVFVNDCIDVDDLTDVVYEKCRMQAFVLGARGASQLQVYASGAYTEVDDPLDSRAKVKDIYKDGDTLAIVVVPPCGP